MKRRPLDFGQFAANPEHHRGIRLARIYSDIFSPPSIFAIFGLTLALLNRPFWEGVQLGLLYGFFSSLIPVLTVVYLVKTGRASDLHMSKVGERHIPYIVGLVGAVTAFFLIRWLSGPVMLQALILCNIAAMAALLLASKTWLISAHMTAMSIIAALTAHFFGLIALALTPFLISTFYLRLFLKRHTSLELAGGLLLGLGIVFSVINMGVIL